MDKCVNCGANVENGKCSYCGTVYNQPNENYNNMTLNDGTQVRTYHSQTVIYNTSKKDIQDQMPLNNDLLQQFTMNNNIPYQNNNTFNQSYNVKPMSQKSKVVAFVLAFFFGMFGIHRFYVGKVASGILYFLTMGIFGLGWFIDIILILCGNFKDCYGQKLK